MVEIQDYKKEIDELYNSINMYLQIGEKKYREVHNISEDDYIFSNVRPLNLIEEKFSKSELEEILKNNSQDKIFQLNLLVRRINHHLLRGHEDIINFQNILNDFSIYLDGKNLF